MFLLLVVICFGTHGFGVSSRDVVSLTKPGTKPLIAFLVIIIILLIIIIVVVWPRRPGPWPT